MAERVLFIGCGDLGQRAARRLLARGDAVYALRRHPPAHDSSGIHWLQGDITCPDGLPALPAGITRVIHVATAGARDPAAYRGVFVDGLNHVLDALDTNRVERIVFVSSSAVYGEHHGDWVDEDTPTAPQGFNGRILLEAEATLAARAIPHTTLRFAGLYGPGRFQLLERLRAARPARRSSRRTGPIASTSTTPRPPSRTWRCCRRHRRSTSAATTPPAAA